MEIPYPSFKYQIIQRRHRSGSALFFSPLKEWLAYLFPSADTPEHDRINNQELGSHRVLGDPQTLRIVRGASVLFFNIFNKCYPTSIGVFESPQNDACIIIPRCFLPLHHMTCPIGIPILCTLTDRVTSRQEVPGYVKRTWNGAIKRKCSV